MVICIQGQAISINVLKVIGITKEGYIHPGRGGAIFQSHWEPNGFFINVIGSRVISWEPRSGGQPCYCPQELLVLLFNPQVCESITISFLIQKSESVNLCLSSRRGLISKAMEETKSSAASGGQSSPAAAAATQQTTNNTPSPISPTPNSPKPISPTPNSPKPISPTPSLLFRSREASSDGSISPCKFISSSDYILN